MSHDQTVIPHLRGGADFAAALAGAPPVGDAVPGLTTLGKVEIHYCLMELPMADVIRALPRSLHPSIPGLLTATFYRVPESPAGPFELAIVAVGCRAGIRPRMLTTASFVDNPVAQDFLRRRWGFAATLATVRTRAGYHGIDSAVTVEGREVLGLATRDAEMLAGAGVAIKFCAPLNPVRLGGDGCLLQVDIGYEYHRAARGMLSIGRFEPAALGLDCAAPQHLICGTQASVDMTLHPWRTTIDPERLAEDGGTTTRAAAAA